MKKVTIALITMCMIAGLATAGYVQIRAVGNTSSIITAATGETLTIEVKVSGFSDQVMQTLALVSFDIAEQTNDGAASGSAADGVVTTTLFSNYTNGTIVNSGGTLIRNITASRDLGTTTGDPDWAVNNTMIYTFEYTTGNVAAGSVTISLKNTESGVPMFGSVMGDDISGDVATSPLNIVVPEPLTIALLGLGGLLVRKRK